MNFSQLETRAPGKRFLNDSGLSNTNQFTKSFCLEISVSHQYIQSIFAVLRCVSIAFLLVGFFVHLPKQHRAKKKR